jgi:hypothetical protein
MSGGAFAAIEGVNEGTLRHWAWRIEGDARRSTRGFVQVVVPRQAGWSGIEVLLRDGICVRVDREFDDTTLSRVIAIVEGR